MDITYNSPAAVDIVPIPGSIVTCRFKLKANPSKIRVDIAAHIYWRKNGLNSTDVKCSNIEKVYTENEDKIHEVNLVIPQYDITRRISSCITLYLQGPIPYTTKAEVEDINVENVNIPVVEESSVITSQSITYPIIKPITKPVISEWHDKIMFVSTWDIKCGIAIYTKDLLDELEKIAPGSFMIRRIELSNHIGAKLAHFQHEFGIMPAPPIVGGKIIITWHSIIPDMSSTIRTFESCLDVVAHIVPCEGALEYMNTSKDVYVVSLGSKLMQDITKDSARKILGLGNIDKPIGFVFGFQSANKNYYRLANAAKECGIHLIISGSMHKCGYSSEIKSDSDVSIINRYLSDEEIDLYTLASDILLFDYIEQSHYSSSSALHRTIGAGRPVVCCNTKHFNDIKEEDGALKFNNIDELVHCIRTALDRKEELGAKILEFAKRTSREEIAKKHIEIYRKYVDI